MPEDSGRYRGCLIGGAIGDALGWPVEFMSIEEIERIYGPQGIQDVPPVSGGAPFTDDTQMTLFTAEGLLQAAEQGLEDPVPSVYKAYERWLHTQGYGKEGQNLDCREGLLSIRELHVKRGPGHTCLSALKSGSMGSVQNPINDSKGCGGVMRVAPVGLLYSRDTAFAVARDCAALTHGHPSGYLSAGVLAHMIAQLQLGCSIEEALADGLEELSRHPRHEECLEALIKARQWAPVKGKTIMDLGEGWVGEEALAMAVFAVLRHGEDGKKALRVAVNHGGDSDSTGAITGNLLGAWMGEESFPLEWREGVQLSSLLLQMAEDLYKAAKHHDL